MLLSLLAVHLPGIFGAGGLRDMDERQRLAQYHQQQQQQQRERQEATARDASSGVDDTRAPTTSPYTVSPWDATHVPIPDKPGWDTSHPPNPNQGADGDSTFAPTQSGTAFDGTYYPEGELSKVAPHIVMIVIDDMGYADMGFKGSGISTPTLDALAKRNTLLTNYYVLTACTHTRVAFMTGKYPYRNGIYKTVNPKDTWGMRAADVTLANELRDRGYQAHAIGKWHLGHAWYDYLPTFRGFQSFLGTWFNQNYFNYSYRSPQLSDVYTVKYDSREFCDLNCSQTPNVKGIYSTELYTDRAVDRIQTYRPAKGPLFLYLAFQGVHEPYQVPDEYVLPYNTTHAHDWSPAKIKYAGMLAAVDQGISKVVRALKTSGLWDNTLLIVTTDNGAPIGDQYGGSNSPFRGKKLQVWEGGIRADAIVAGGARGKLGIPAGTNRNLFHAVDWLPTLAGLVDLTQGKSPPGSASSNNATSTIDGVSQVRSLRGGAADRSEAYLGYQSPGHEITAYRRGDLKLVREASNRYSLYNLTRDVAETTNLIGTAAYKSDVGYMKRKINAYERQFQLEPDKIGYCPKMSTDLTTWGQRTFFTWCEADRRKQHMYAS